MKPMEWPPGAAFASRRPSSIRRAWPLLAALALLPQAGVLGAGEEPPLLTILFTAEVHGALLPCDCPLQPLGGVARRAAAIERYRRRGPVLLLDAGGWSAGGLYDEAYSGDPARELLRTNLMAESMLRMGYDALAWGQEESVWAAQAPAGSAFDRLAPLRVKPFAWRPGTAAAAGGRLELGEIRTVQRAGMTLGLAAVEEDLPASADQAFWKLFAATPRDEGFFVLLAPLGEEASERLALASAGLPHPFGLLINAGRKSSQRVGWQIAGLTLANFDYQARQLGVVEVFRRKTVPGGGSRPFEFRVRHEPLTPEVPGAPALEELLRPHLADLSRKGKARIEVEYWTMGHCQHCRKVSPELEALALELAGRVRIEPHFLVAKDEAGRFQSLHGEGELQEDRIQALIVKYYPERYWAWLRWREGAGNRDAPWEKGAAELGLLRARLRGALAAGEADEILERDYRLSQRRRIEGTPALVIANKIYDGPLERLRILQALCGLLEAPRPDACAAVPHCFFDAQCRKRGFVGRCLEPGTPRASCDFSRQAVRVPAVVLVEPGALWSNHEQILEILLGYLPGLEWRMVDPSSEEGRELVGRHGLERLPAYLLDPAAREELNFESNLGRTLRESAGRLVALEGQTGAHRLVGRTRMPGTADLFVARFSKQGQQAVEVALEVLAREEDAPLLTFHDLLYWRQEPPGTGKRELAAPGGIAEIEEAALAWAVRVAAPERLWAYLKARGQRRASLYWDRAVAEIGLDPAKVRALAEGPSPEILRHLEAEADLVGSLKVGGNVVLLAENCELVPVQSRRELLYYLEWVGRRRDRGPAVKRPAP